MIGGFIIADGEPHEQLVEENLARDDEPTKAERELVDPLNVERFQGFMKRHNIITLLILTGVSGLPQPAPSRPDGKFVNLSTRALVETGEEVMIGGFIIGEDSKQVLIQAVGPELVNVGISNALADPVLTVTRASDGMELMVNDNWEDSQKQLITDLWGGNPPLPAGSLSSAAVLTLEPGNYTAKVEGKNGTAGVAIVEVLGINSPGADGKFVNLSTRALVETGEEVMIGGFIIGEDSKQVLIQAVGPELANAGITNALADPVLTITDTTDPGNPMELTVNDNWEDSQGQLVSDLWGGSPNLVPGSLSSAAVLTLEPGNYTAKVEGKNGTTGVAIVEVYDVDAPDAEPGHAPADQAAFDALVVGKQIGSDANNRLVFLSSGRIREIEDGTPYEGNYKYENTGANTGTLTYTYDATDNDPAAEKTVIEMTFTSEGAGTLVSTYTEAGSRPEVISGPFELADTDGGPPDSTDYKPLEGLRVSRGRVQFGFSRTGGCIRMANTTINGVNYTSHGSEWQRRAEADSPWADVPGTEESGGLCALDPTEPGEYRMIADITIDGTRGRYSSENTFTITVEPPDTMPSFATGSGPGNQTYTVGAAIDALTLPQATGGDGTLTYSLSPNVPGLSFNARARQLTGRPTTSGTYNMTYTVRDADVVFPRFCGHEQRSVCSC